MPDTTPFAHVPAWAGAPVRDRDGRACGQVVEVRFDEVTHAPAAFVLADGSRHALVPAKGAVSFAGFVRVPYPALEIWGPAPRAQPRPAAVAA